MTERLYYDDAYLTRFTAMVRQRFAYQGRPAVVLDRTAFYPTSGGQPFDTGTLGGIPVVDVVVRETDSAVLHVLDTHLDQAVTEVWGEIDWGRRFDHMQHHTGQHILSQACIQVAQAETVGFHLGTESVTIDLAGPQPLSDPVLAQVETLTNRILWEDRPVTARVVPHDRLGEFPLRKPPTVSTDVRIVQVEGFDWSACGGTHVARTGQVGLLKIVKSERRGDQTRVEFRCGQRALQDYQAKHQMIQHVAAGFNVGYWELDQAVERLRAEAKDLRSRLREAGRSLTHYAATELQATAPTVAQVRWVVHSLSDEALVDMRELARRLVATPDLVAILGEASVTPEGLKAQLCFARSPGIALDLVPVLRQVAQSLGGRGGGQPDLAQGGGLLTDRQQLDTVLEQAARRLVAQLEKAQ
jgi:alanyl-tRNA synthetase